jgi:peptidoglycan L-alanyl-D-glutamate endopeptidase CwlK
MMLFAAMAYFALACLLAALLLLSGFRAWVLNHASQIVLRLKGSHRSARKAVQDNARAQFSQASDAARDSSRWAQRHWRGLLAATALLALPPLLVFSLRAKHTLDAFDDSTTASDRGVVIALLQGEQLVPPPPLPPEIFVTAEVESVRPKLGGADRRWDALDSAFRQRLLVVYRLMREEHGYDMVLIEGYRSPERQTMLAAMGTQVTNAAAWQSYHQYGLAADSAFMREGKLVISEKDAWAVKGYELYGEVAQRVGLSWGGRWQNADLGHVELRKSVVTHPKEGP